MNRISSTKARQLSDCFTQGLSVREAAEAVGVDKNTAWSHKSQMPFPTKTPTITMTTKLSGPMADHFVVAAAARNMTPDQLASKVLEIVVRDNIFDAVIDA